MKDPCTAQDQASPGKKHGMVQSINQSIAFYLVLLGFKYLTVVKAGGRWHPRWDWVLFCVRWG